MGREDKHKGKVLVVDISSFKDIKGKDKDKEQVVVLYKVVE